MSKEVIGFSPSLVDISAQLPDAQYQSCCEVLGLEPGGWKRIETADEFSQLAKTVTGDSDTNSLLDTINARDDATINPGSSILGMLSAMPPHLRHNSSLVTTLARQSGVLDPLSSFFNRAVVESGICHDYQPAPGFNPVGFVLSGQTNTEKTLAMYPGVAGDLDPYDLSGRHPDLVIVDAYELQGTKLAEYLDELIKSGSHRIGLSLGNHSILTGPLRQQIRKYIASHKIGVLCGNSLEYDALYDELDQEAASRDGFRSHPVCDDVPYVVMTFGEEGMIAQWDGKYIADSVAYPLDPSRIVNTSGAGDTTAGVVYGGILEGRAGQETLQKAAYFTTRVLQTSSSRILADC